jgi:molybdopterin molybdotransferase
MKLMQVDTVEQVKEKINLHFSDINVDTEAINIQDALGRVAAKNIYSSVNIPDFNKSTVDGFAVVSKDTFGASESLPTFLDIIGKVSMGEATNLKVSSGKAVYVPTGGMLPMGADAMVMIEYIENLDEITIAVYTSTAPGENIIFVGDDIKNTELLLSKGEIIKSQHIGVLAACGVKEALVYKKPTLAIISTGDEITDPFGDIKSGQVRDINTYILAAMAKEMGSEVTFKGLVKDDYDSLVNIIKEHSNKNEVVIISGGSSAGDKDYTAKAIDSLGESGVFVHGVAVKPGKPTIVGKVGKSAVFGLPGHPVSAAVIFKVFVGYLLNRLMCIEPKKLFIQAKCNANIHSSPGKVTYQMVQIYEENNQYIAMPIYAKSAAISLLAKAHGYIEIPMNKEGITKDEMVKVELL